MKALLILSLLLLSTTASAYCVHYDNYGRCDQQDQYSIERDNRIKNNTYIKPLPVIPPLGTSNCQWILINNQWQSVCR